MKGEKAPGDELEGHLGLRFGCSLSFQSWKLIGCSRSFTEAAFGFILNFFLSCHGEDFIQQLSRPFLLPLNQ